MATTQGVARCGGEGGEGGGGGEGGEGGEGGGGGEGGEGGEGAGSLRAAAAAVADSQTGWPSRRLPTRTRFFVIKSFCARDLKLSMQRSVWATQPRNEQVIASDCL